MTSIEQPDAREAANEIVNKITLVDGKGHCFTISSDDQEWLEAYLLERIQTARAQGAIDENLACQQIMAKYWKTSEMIAVSRDRIAQLKAGEE